jgi:hypothetical protein
MSHFSPPGCIISFLGYSIKFVYTECILILSLVTYASA